MTPIDVQTDGACAVITIDRPQARNAVSPQVAQGIEAAIDRLEADDRLRVGILTGAPPVFCAGADLKVVGAGRGAELSTARGGFGGLVRRARTKPLIAAVDGAALAGGLELVLACDLVVASTAASFGAPVVRRGLLAAAGALLRLPDRLPRNLAMELVLTGVPIDAPTAHRHGLVNRLCVPGDALTTAQALAAEIAANGPLAVRLAREVLLEACDGDTDAFWAANDAANTRIMATDDVQEGVRAFVEKRPAVFTGR